MENDEWNHSGKMHVVPDKDCTETTIENAEMCYLENHLNKSLIEERSIRHCHNVEYDTEFAVYAHPAQPEIDLMNGKVHQLDDAIKEILSDLNDLVL